MLRKYAKWIETNKERFIVISDKIWEYAETGLEEHKSSKLLADTLKNAGFNIERGVADIPTAFYASYGEGRPVISILGEYDALPGISQVAEPIKKSLKEGAPGHGCGHNLLGVAGLSAALSVKEAIDEGDAKGTIRFYGCPAEEMFNSKGYMIKYGAFDDVDICLTWHPDCVNMLNDMSALAVNSVVFKFHGRTAHAAGDPQNGRSALDAVELMNIGANYLREHMISDARLHYVITHGGEAPNVVPEYAEVWYFIRAPERYQVDELYGRVVKIAEGATLMTETKMEIEFLSGMYNTIYNKVVQEVIKKAMRKVGAPKFDEKDREFAEELKKSLPPHSMDGYMKLVPPKLKELALQVFSQPLNTIVLPTIGSGQVLPGSTDVADVSWNIPLGEFIMAGSIIGAPGHSWQNAACAGMGIGHKGMLAAAKVLTLSAIEFMNKPELVEEAKQEFEEQHKDKKYKVPFPEGLKPPFHRLSK